MVSLRTVVTRSPNQMRSRAVVKTLLYRAFMLAITVVVAYAVTGTLAEAASIGVVTNVVKTATYYLYERAWDRVAWGVQ